MTKQSPASSPSAIGDEFRIVAASAVVWISAAVALRLPPVEFDLRTIALPTAIMVMIAVPIVRRLAPVPMVWVLPLAAMLAFVSGQRAAAGFQPLEPGTIATVAKVRSDPEPIGSGWRVELSLPAGDRLEAIAFGSTGFVVRRLEVGQRVEVNGRLRDIGSRHWLRARRITARLSLESIEPVAEPGRWDRFVNGLRRTIADGASTMSGRRRALYNGLVIGDDRFQPLAQRAQFQASGLTHLLAVSGQNVAFVLLVVRPVIMLLGYRTRIVVIVVVLLVFVAVTRAEPSVLRAASASAVGAWAAVNGRSRAGLRALAIGTMALIVYDPFLVDVVGFQLSVAASAGIIAFGPVLTSRLPLPGPLPEAVAVTVAAQLGVAPLLINRFGPLPMASLPANLAAGWAAGAVMTIGLTLGPISGFAAGAGFDRAAWLLQSPALLLVTWIDVVASWSASLPLPRVNGRAMIVLGTTGLMVRLRPRQRLRPPPPLRWRIFSPAVLVVAALLALSTLFNGVHHPPGRPTAIADNVLYLPPSGGAPSVLIVGEGAPNSLVDAVIEARLTRIDIVITERGDTIAGRLVTALTQAADIELVLAPSLHRIRGARRVTSDLAVESAWGPINIESVGDGHDLAITFRPRPQY